MQVHGLLERLPSGTVDALWLWLVLRVGLGILAAFLFIGGELPTPCDSDIATNGWKTFPPLADGPVTFPLVGVWQHWDACWYSKIAAFGYEPGESSTAFFPLLPLLMRAGSALFGGVALAGLVVSGIALVVGLAGLWQLVARDFAAFLAALARPHGILLAIPLLWEAVRWLIADRQRSAGGRLGRRQIMPVAAAAAPVLAGLLYFWYTSAIVGRSLIDAQSPWSRGKLRWPWDSVTAALERINSEQDMVTALNLAALVIFTGLFVAGLRRVPVSYSLYALPQLVLVAIRAPTFPLMSGARYMAVLFPCFVVLALANRSPRLHTAWVLVSLLLLGFFTTMFLRGGFIG